MAPLSPFTFEFVERLRKDLYIWKSDDNDKHADTCDNVCDVGSRIGLGSNIPSIVAVVKLVGKQFRAAVYRSTSCWPSGENRGARSRVRFTLGRFDRPWHYSRIRFMRENFPRRFKVRAARDV